MKINKLLFLLIICTLINKKSISQVDSAKNNFQIIVSPGISLQREIFGELNIMFAKEVDGGACDNNGYKGFRIGVESNFEKNNLIVAPKIGWEGSTIPICLRGNIIDYLSNGKSDLRLLPEVGIRFDGYILPT